ncbi:MAG: hypothetical protein K5672_02905 [Bacteroidaceae bacterium]|nr:hypothetical protein [Bacteroidaceae bacterium]
MKKIIAIMLFAAFAAVTQGQQPNARLQQLEKYLPTQDIGVEKKQYSHAGGVVYTASTHTNIIGTYGSFKKGISEEERQQRILTVNTRHAQKRQKMEGVVDYFRTTFVNLSKESATESYMYENHKNGIDTIKYSYLGLSQEAAKFDFRNKLHKDNPNGIDDYSDYYISYDHSYTISNGIKEDDMKPFDGEAFCAYIQPVIKKFMKLKGAKAYPVHWQHDEGFENNADFVRTPKYGRSKHEFETHPGLVTGTHYIIPSEHEAIAKNLYRQLDSLAYDYVNKHPEQPYTYKFTSEFIGSDRNRIVVGLPEIVKGDICKGGDEFYLCCKREQDGQYHILTLNSKGVYWTLQDWAILKSYINGEKVYIKGMEPKEEKK